MNLFSASFLLILGFIPAFSFADATQERRLTISASIFPKIVALDQDLSLKQNAEGTIVLGVLYLDNRDSAEKTASIIQKKVKKLAGSPVKIDVLSISKLVQNTSETYAGHLLAEPLQNENIGELISHAEKHHVLLFSPFEGDIERGISSSIFVGAKIRPYFNLPALKKTRINLKPAILKVSKIYE